MSLWDRTFLDIQDIAWKELGAELGYPLGAFAGDAAREVIAGEERKRVNLTLLTIFSKMAQGLDLSVLKAENEALRAGATYADIAAAEGVSRQAVRQRRKRNAAATRRHEVTLLGGPFNGRVVHVFSEKEIRYSVSIRADSYDDAWNDMTWVARYTRSPDDDQTYVFASIDQVGGLGLTLSEP
jgi:hypothetical protein